MSQLITIVVRFREDSKEAFLTLFEEEILPMWKEFRASGKFLGAALTPVEDGSEVKEGVQDYVLTIEVPGLAEHTEFDEHPRFLAFLEKVKPMLTDEPLVWFGDPLHRV